MEWVNNSTNRWINKRGRTLRWLSRKRGGAGFVQLGEPPMAERGQLSLPEHVPSVQFWTLAPVQASAAVLPLPVHRIYTNICFPTKKKEKKKKKRGHAALDRSAFRHSAWPCLPVLYTKTLMHPVKPLAGDTISSQAPIKPSVSTCDKDDHLFS